VVFEWDPAKAGENAQKHGVRFADAEGVFEDPYALHQEDDQEAEARWVRIGFDRLGRLVVVSYTERDEKIRLISARKADKGERDQYRIRRDALEG
jgi:uncharacterized DUF497 family protein